jgi:NADH/NAD ratio-sensing transcriptional regulator Rex
MKKVCAQCGYWTENPRDRKCKCYTSNCPAKKRDDKRRLTPDELYYKINVLSRMIEKDIKNIFDKCKRIGYTTREIRHEINETANKVSKRLL